MIKHQPGEFEHVFGSVIDDVTGLLERSALPYMLIGGLAVAVRAEERATKDIDLAVRVDAAGALTLMAEMTSLGFGTLLHGVPGPGAVLRFSRTGADGIERWVDILAAGTVFEEEAIGRATVEQLLGRNIPVVTPEDLVIFKLLAGRPQDLADVDKVLREHAGHLDDPYLDARALEWEISELLAHARAVSRRS